MACSLIPAYNEELLENNRQGNLRGEEQAELDEVERLGHLMRRLKARIRQKLQLRGTDSLRLVDPRR